MDQNALGFVSDRSASNKEQDLQGRARCQPEKEEVGSRCSSRAVYQRFLCSANYRLAHQFNLGLARHPPSRDRSASYLERERVSCPSLARPPSFSSCCLPPDAETPACSPSLWLPPSPANYRPIQGSEPTSQHNTPPPPSSLFSSLQPSLCDSIPISTLVHPYNPHPFDNT